MLVRRFIPCSSTPVDCLSKQERSAMMARVKNRDTRPEMVVRRALTALGYRYRLHARDLPGKPDIVFRGRRKLVFVHGCFWHQHRNCKKAGLPSTRRAFWEDKLTGNAQRDARVLAELIQTGWDPLVVWECETKGDTLPQILLDFLEHKESA